MIEIRTLTGNRTNDLQTAEQMTIPIKLAFNLKKSMFYSFQRITHTESPPLFLRRELNTVLASFENKI